MHRAPRHPGHALRLLALRWILGIALIVLGGFFVVSAIVSNGFRRLLHEPELPVLQVALPLLALAVVLAALVMPRHRTLLHAAALAALGLVGFCIWLLVAELAIDVLWALPCLAGWFWFYRRALAAAAPVGR